MTRTTTIPNLVLAQRVIDKMCAAASRFLMDETGEALVGLLVPGTHTNGIPTLYVLDTIAPDESAVREWGTFQQGDDRQDEIIWWLQENWRIYREQKLDKDGRYLLPKWDVPLRYLGDWHKQPGFMIQPSQGDLLTARNWLADPSNGMGFLLAPILTLGYSSSDIPEVADPTFITHPRGDDTSVRVDFWYIDREWRDFIALRPSIYPNHLLPGLPDYPWHLNDESRFHAEYDLLSKNGLFTALVLWDADGKPPLDVCLLTARPGADQAVILVTPWNYPQQPPHARAAPVVDIQDGDDIFSIFEELWDTSQPVNDPPGWVWSDGRRLYDYLLALEDHLGIKAAPPPEDKS